MAAGVLKKFSHFFARRHRIVSKHTRNLSSHAQSSRSTVDTEEVSKFSELCNEFWDVNGSFQALHTMNRIRVPMIRDAILGDKSWKLTSKPLKDKTILDIGCGGGILCEPLARLGANVMGIDASREAISVAKYHAREDPDVCDRVNYKCITAEELVDQSHSFDAVVASEVIEHVSDQELFIKSISQLTKAGGSLVLTTINRTIHSYLFAILAAEYLLNVIECGTHDWNKFIRDDDLASLIISNGFTIQAIQGLQYNPFTRNWFKVNDTSVNYALVAHKEPLHSINGNNMQAVT